MIKLNVPLLLIVLISGFSSIVGMEENGADFGEGSTDSSGFVKLPGNPSTESIPTPPPVPKNESNRSTDLKGKEREDIRDEGGSTVDPKKREEMRKELAALCTRKSDSVSPATTPASAEPRASFFNVYRSVLGCVVGGGLLFTLYYYLTQPKPEPLEDIDLVDIEIE